MRLSHLVFSTALILSFPAQAGFFEKMRDAAVAPIKAPVEAVKDIVHGRPPNEIVQNQLNIRVGAPAVAAGEGIQLIQRGNDFVQSIPRDFINRNLGGDWLRGYDLLTSSQRVQQEMAFTAGMYLSHCAATRQCSPEQAAAMPVAAALRDAYKTYLPYSQPLPPQLAMMLSRVVPPHVLAGARWATGRIPDMTFPGFINAAYAAAGGGHCVTVGNLMIFSEIPNLQYAQGVNWLLHELFHIEQYMRYSGNALESIDGFAVEYVRNFNGLENEAQNNADSRYGNLYRFAQQ